MTLEILKAAKNTAMKERNETRKNALNNMIDAVQKAAITPKGRVEITDQLVDEVLIKYQKSVQEQIDTCPADRVKLLSNYKAEMDIVKEFAPQLITDPAEIKLMIKDAINGEMAFTKENRGKIMKIVSPVFKGKADMKIVSQVVAEMIE